MHITDANVILSITAGCKEYICSSHFIVDICVTALSKTPYSAWEGMTFGQLIVRKIIKIITTRCQILRLKSTKIDFGWGSAPEHAGELSLTALPQTPYSWNKRDLLLREWEMYR